MGLIKEFRDFAMRGNVVDLAVGVIIGAAFGGVVTSLVNDIIMPPIGQAMSRVDFKNMYHGLANQPRELDIESAKKMGAVIAYGNFITVLINFIIVAFCVFLVVKMFNTAMRRFQEKPAAAPPAPTPDQKLLTEIRDLLARRA